MTQIREIAPISGYSLQEISRAFFAHFTVAKYYNKKYGGI